MTGGGGGGWGGKLVPLPSVEEDSGCWKGGGTSGSASPPSPVVAAVVVAAAVGASEWAEEAEGVWVAVEVRGERGPRRAITEEEGDKDDEEKVDLDVDEAPSANARVAEEGDWTLLVVAVTGVVEVVASSGRSCLSPAAL
mmetsp:Transcript_71497/g.143946  ORF Transcript_71497/g.143946 Transcript_71497/m.143946 type:complete len:140 (-) Transcript_71497:800-1219(-)